eukprot:2024234-Pyramimonas_sp.AAC.1
MQRGASLLDHVQQAFELTDRLIARHQHGPWKLGAAFVGLILLWLCANWDVDVGHHHRVTLDDVFSQYEREHKGQYHIRRNMPYHDSDSDSDFMLSEV